MNSTAPTSPLAPWLEQAWLARYLERQLGAEEIVWFEAYLLDRPGLIEQLELDSALRAVLSADAEAANSFRAELDRVPSADPDAVASPLFKVARGGNEAARSMRRSRPRSYARWASAASFVFGLGLGALALQPWLANTDPTDSTGFAAAPSRLVFDALRGSYAEPRVDAGDPTSELMIVDVAMPLGFSIVKARAELAEGALPLPLAPISSEGFATYSLPARWRGQALLHFELVGEDGESDRIEIRL